MGWKFPKHKMRDGEVLDIDSFNENAYEFAAEAGKLNEHNWKQNTFNSESILDKSSRIRARRIRKTNGLTSNGVANPNNSIEVEAGSSWAPVPEFVSSFGTSGGLFLILASWQQDTRSDGIMWALSVNGQLIPETILGTGEHGNDRISNDPAVGTGGTSQSSPGIQRRRIGLATQVILPVIEGTYTIRLNSYQMAGDWVNVNYIPLGSLIVLELFR